jgi:glycosyltransferase involved in cell wall biosynthesis
MNDPKVSIVLTLYNTEEYCVDAVQSILDQTYSNIELIIVDDCSTDSSLNLITELIELQEDTHNIKIIKNKINRGTYFCRNLGIYYSKGAFIGFQDSDDVSDKDRIKEQIELQIKTQSLCSTCEGTRHQGKMVFASTIYHRAVFDVLGYYDNVRCAGDHEFLYRLFTVYNTRKYKLFRKGRRYIHVDTILYYVTEREGSLTKIIPHGSARRVEYVKATTKIHKDIHDGKCEAYVPFSFNKDNIECIHGNIKFTNIQKTIISPKKIEYNSGKKADIENSI